MIPLSNTPWELEMSQQIVDSTGNTVVQLTASHFTREECTTILRAISQLPLILNVLEVLYEDPAGLPQDLHYAIRSIIAYVLPIEHSAEVATSRWLHAQSSTYPQSVEALRGLTLALSDTLNGDISHYPQPVQDAFAHAMSLLNLSKHMKHE